MVCPGGELAFVRRMVEESAQLQGAVHWYTTMLGKKVRACAYILLFAEKVPLFEGVGQLSCSCADPVVSTHKQNTLEKHSTTTR